MQGKYYIKNMDLVGFHNVNDKMAFQMAYYEAKGRRYLYCACFRDPGWHILDVTDPEHIRYIKWLECPDLNKFPNTNCPKIQVADGLMITALAGSIPHLTGAEPGKTYLDGVFIWDLKEDPENPKLLSHWSTGVKNGFGVHRFFYNGGRYVHLSASCPGFSTLIYRILDIQNPANPVEVGRWWLPEQWLAGQQQPEVQKPKPVWELMDEAGLHGPPYVVGNRAYLSYSGAGAVILDISDITLPRLLGRLRLSPPFSGVAAGARCHTFLPLTSRGFAVATNEGERFAVYSKEALNSLPTQPMGNLHMIDVHDPRHPALVAEFPYPEVPDDWPWDDFNDCGLGAPGPLGPHNLHEPKSLPHVEDNSNRVYCCYFHAGLRVYNVKNPYRPREIAYFIPPMINEWKFHHFPGPKVGTSEDIVVDDRGYIFIDTFHDGIYVLRLKDNID
jgi:hypothetical protein